MSEGVSATPHAALLGPVDRESFFDAQRRHRRAARCLTAVVGVGMTLVSLPLASILFPLLFTLVSLVLDLLNLVVATPNLLGMIGATGGHFAEGPDWLFELFVMGLIVCTPGMLVMLAMWRALWRVFHDGRTADIMATISARRARQEDPEERQLVNLVEEMAIAAGIHPPAIMIFDGDAVNATVFGSSEATATLLVSRRLLEECDRDATQGLIGHLIAGIANGDLRLAMEIITGFAAIGLARELLKTPFSAEGRAVLGQMVYFMLRPTAENALALRGPFLERLLSDDQNIDIDSPHPSLSSRRASESGTVQQPQAWWQRKGKEILFWILLPLLLGYTTFNLVTFAANLLFLSPWLSLLLRQRRYLMDATAVQLTRNPEALRRGLGQLIRQSQPALPDLREGLLMFVVQPKVKTKGDAAPMGMFFGIYPSGSKRWDRIAAMGAGAVRRPSMLRLEELRTPKGMLVAGLVILLVGLFVLLTWMLLFLIAASTMLALMVGMVWVMVVCMPINLLLR